MTAPGASRRNTSDQARRADSDKHDREPPAGCDPRSLQTTMPTQMSHESLARRYIELLQGCLSRELFIDEEPHDVDPGPIARRWAGV